VKFIFEDNIVRLDKGTLSTNDYVIYHNEVKFTDQFLFRSIIAQISSEELAIDFIRCCINYSEIQLDNDALLINKSPLDVSNVYEYCTALDLPPEIQKLLFLWILRCDIDNINFPPPKFNGGIRIFTQVLILLAYKFKWNEYYIEEYYIESVDILKDLPKSIYLIGHPNNKYSLSKSAFKEIYSKFLKNIKRYS